MKRIILCILAALAMVVIYLIAINVTINPKYSLGIIAVGGFCGAWLLSNINAKEADRLSGNGDSFKKPF